MSDDTASGLFSVMNGPDGIIDLSKVKESSNDEIMVKSLIEFESGFNDVQKKALLTGNIQLQEGLSLPQFDERISVEERKGTIELQLRYKKIEPDCFAVEIIQ